MSTPTNFEGSTHHFGPPPGVPETECGWLHVFSNGRCTVSAWKLSPEALAAANRGEPVFVSHQCGVHPFTDKPIVFPTFVGSEEECKSVVSGTGETW